MNELELVINEVKKAVVGKDEHIKKILACILARCHVLLEDIPGVGKTNLTLALSKALSLDFHRMQFTSDVLPGDVTGFIIYNQKTNDFEYKEGPIMCNLFLADEINRTSPKTQSALLEVMEEGTTHLSIITTIYSPGYTKSLWISRNTIITRFTIRSFYGETFNGIFLIRR